MIAVEKEEIIEILIMMKGAWMMVGDTSEDLEATKVGVQALDAAISALKGPTREQVEKAEWIWSTGDVYTCSSCGEKTHVDECMENPIYNFCPFCMAPMTDEAVDMVMERLEEVQNDQ